MPSDFDDHLILVTTNYLQFGTMYQKPQMSPQTWSSIKKNQMSLKEAHSIWLIHIFMSLSTVVHKFHFTHFLHLSGNWRHGVSNPRIMDAYNSVLADSQFIWKLQFYIYFSLFYFYISCKKRSTFFRLKNRKTQKKLELDVFQNSF